MTVRRIGAEPAGIGAVPDAGLILLAPVENVQAEDDRDLVSLAHGERLVAPGGDRPLPKRVLGDDEVADVIRAVGLEGGGVVEHALGHGGEDSPVVGAETIYPGLGHGADGAPALLPIGRSLIGLERLVHDRVPDDDAV